MIKNNTLVFVGAALMASTVFADLNTQRVQKLFPEAMLVEHKELKPGLFEVQMKPNNSTFKRTAFYTNEDVDFVTSRLSLVDGDDLSVPVPDFGYSSISLDQHATFVSGEGKPRYIFANPLSPEGLPGLTEVLKDKEYKNYVFIHFDKESSEQSYLMLPFYYGDNAKRLNVALSTVKLFKDMAYGKISEADAQKITGDRIKEIKNNMTTGNVDTLVDSMRSAMELAEIVADNKSFAVYDKNKIDVTPKPKEIQPKHQQIKAFDFKAYGEAANNRLLNYYRIAKSGQKIAQYDFSDVENFERLIEDSTAYKVGTGKKEVLLFTDIDCPYCVRLEQNIDKYLRPDVTVRVMFYPIQGLHPNALDKHRHILSVPVSDRQALSSRIRGTGNNGAQSKQSITDLTPEQLKPLDEIISKSFTLGNLFNVVGTPTVMSYQGGIIKNLPNANSILSIK